MKYQNDELSYTKDLRKYEIDLYGSFFYDGGHPLNCKPNCAKYSLSYIIIFTANKLF